MGCISRRARTNHVQIVAGRACPVIHVLQSPLSLAGRRGCPAQGRAWGNWVMVKENRPPSRPPAGEIGRAGGCRAGAGSPAPDTRNGLQVRLKVRIVADLLVDL